MNVTVKLALRMILYVPFYKITGNMLLLVLINSMVRDFVRQSYYKVPNE